jgi:hypothetical protein
VDEVPVLAERAAGPDPGVGLQAAAALRRLADQLELQQVRLARTQGWSWREIAWRLDLTAQAVHHKYAKHIDAEES